MEGLRGSNQRVDRMHPRDRGRVGPLPSRPFNREKTRVPAAILYRYAPYICKLLEICWPCGMLF